MDGGGEGVVGVVARSWRRWRRQGAQLFKGGAWWAAFSGVRTHSAYCTEDRGDLDVVAPSLLIEPEIPQTRLLASPVVLAGVLHALFTEAVGRISSRFYVLALPEVAAMECHGCGFALENLNIISTSSSYDIYCSVSVHSHVNGEEFFAIEGFLAQLARTLLT